MKNKFITILNTTINNSFKLKVTSKKEKNRYNSVINIFNILFYVYF